MPKRTILFFALFLLGLQACTDAEPITQSSSTAFFEENVGQTDEEVEYLYRNGNQMVFFTPSKIVFKFKTQEKVIVIHKTLLGANPSSRIRAQKKLRGVSNYLIGNNKEKWKKNIAHYQELIYQEVYPGVDLKIQDLNGRLGFQFLTQSAENLSKIQMQYEGQDQISIKQDKLEVRTREGTLAFSKLIANQSNHEKKQAAFVSQGDQGVGIEIKDLQPGLPANVSYVHVF